MVYDLFQHLQRLRQEYNTAQHLLAGAIIIAHRDIATSVNSCVGKA